MNSNTRSSLLLLILILISVLAGCTETRAQEAQLPDGMSLARVPRIPLDGYLYARQGQPLALPGTMVGLPLNPAIQSLEAWIAPSESTESIGALLTLSGQADAEAAFRFIPERPDLWKLQTGNSIYIVWGTGKGSEDLKRAIQDKQFVSLKEADKDAWRLIERLPGSPAPRPLAVAFVRTEDRLINFVQKNSPLGADESLSTAIELAKIKAVAAAFYSTRDLQLADFLSSAGRKDAGIGGILVARSSYPGAIISTALGQAAPRLNLEKTSVDGRTAYYRAADTPTGEKVHVLLSNSGQHIYVNGAADLSRTQQLFRWVWGIK